MDAKIGKIKKEIKPQFEANDWDYHVLAVAKYAKELAAVYGENPDHAELAAVLHDIGRANVKNDAGHHIKGADMSETLMRKYGYHEETVKKIKFAVLRHCVIDEFFPQTVFEKIIANADAMSHFDIVPLFFYWRTKDLPYPELVKWLSAKLERDWNEKITLPEARRRVEQKYQAAKTLLINQ